MELIDGMLEKLLKEETNNTMIQIFRYTLSGTIAVIVDFYFLLIFTEVIGMHYLASTAFAYIISVFVNYATSIGWVFNIKNNRNKTMELGIFFITGFSCLITLELLMWVITESMNLHYLLSKVIITFSMSLFNFHIRRYLLNTMHKLKNYF